MDEILLRRMSKDEFESYFQNKIERYSDVLSENIHEQGDDPSTKALKQLKGLLPNGIKTPNHHLFNIQRGEKVIGFVWLKMEEEKKSAFLYEIYIFENFRGKGFGTETMNCIENFLIQKKSIILNFMFSVVTQEHVNCMKSLDLKLLELIC